MAGKTAQKRGGEQKCKNVLLVVPTAVLEIWQLVCNEC